MQNRKVLYIGVVLVVLALGAVLSFGRKADRQETTVGEVGVDLTEKETFMQPQPVEQLLFVKKTDGAFTPEQRQAMDEFKAKILARAGLGVELTEQEKSIFTTVLSDREAMLPGNDIVVNQSILKFSAEEIGLISEALKR